MVLLLIVDDIRSTNMGNYINLLDPNHAYLIGFIYGDGSLTNGPKGRNKGKMEIEINIRDADILQKFQEIVPVYSSLKSRNRETRFSNRGKIYKNETMIFTISDFVFRQELNQIGVPFGKKSLVIRPPRDKYSVPDFWRGFIDADGSLGLTKPGLPFISLVTASAPMAQEYLFMAWKVTRCYRSSSRNKRDNIFNILYMREPAQQIIRYLYYPGCLTLQRKMEMAIDALNWTRPEGMRKRVLGHKWREEEDDYILNHSSKESMTYLGVKLWTSSMSKKSIEKNSKYQEYLTLFFTL
jgi:hypothetical protein